MSKLVQTWVATTPTQTWKSQAYRAAPAAATNLLACGQTDQTWRGFGGCFNELGYRALSALPKATQREVMDALFADAGCAFSYCRLPIGASDYAESWYSLNETPGDYAMKRFSIERDRTALIPYIRQALTIRQDLTLFASPWSPPTWMKSPAAYNFGTLVWDKKTLEAYALYFLKFVQAYAKEGIRIAQVHIQNEPNSDQKFPSCLWTGVKMRDFIRDHIGPLFTRTKTPCEIWAGTIERPDYNAWANTILSDAKAHGFVRGVGYQWAGKFAALKTHQAWPDVPIVQTENECGDGNNTWDYARYVFDLIHHYLTSGVVAYTYWNMILQPGGGSTWGWKQNTMITIDPATRKVSYNPEYWVMKHFAHFVRPGARRLVLQGPLCSNAIAFANPNGQTVLVVNNPFDRPQTLAARVGDKAISATLEPMSYNTLVLNCLQ